MTIATMKTGLRVATLGGMLGLLPGVAWADGATPSSGEVTSRDVPDHAAAEARGAGKDFNSSEASGDADKASTGGTSTEADHTTLETGAIGVVDSSNGTTSTVTDHASVERRGASPDLP
jgi:hypothetical protein